MTVEARTIGLSKRLGTQDRFLESPAGDVLFGGAAGGGKTVVLFWDAVARCVAYAGYNAAIFRRHYGELGEKIIPWLRDLPRELGKWREADKVFIFNNGCRGKCVHGWPEPHLPSRLAVHHLEHLEDVHNHKGADFHYLGLDEMTSFEIYQLRYLIGRCMRGPSYLPRRLRATSNPDGPSHAWVKERYHPDQEEMEGKVWQPYEEGKAVMTRQFIRSSWEDNEFIDREAYSAQLETLPEPIRSAHKWGDWNITVSTAFPEWSDAHQCDPFEPPEEWPRSAGVDHGYTEPWCVEFLAHDYSLRDARDPRLHRVYVYDELYAARVLPHIQAQWIRQRSPHQVTLPSDMRVLTGTQYGEESPQRIYERELRGVSRIRMAPRQPLERVHRKQRLHQFLGLAPDGRPWLQVMRTRAPHLVRTLPNLMTDPTRPEDVRRRGLEDHPYDSLSYDLNSLYAVAEERPRIPAEYH